MSSHKQFSDTQFMHLQASSQGPPRRWPRIRHFLRFEPKKRLIRRGWRGWRGRQKTERATFTSILGQCWTPYVPLPPNISHDTESYSLLPSAESSYLHTKRGGFESFKSSQLPKKCLEPCCLHHHSPTLRSRTISQMKTVSVSEGIVYLVVLLICYYISLGTYRLFFCKIAGFPGPRLAALTFWYEFYYDIYPHKHQYVFKIKELHEQYGMLFPIRRSLRPWKSPTECICRTDNPYQSSPHPHLRP